MDYLPYKISIHLKYDALRLLSSNQRQNPIKHQTSTNINLRTSREWIDPTTQGGW